jgi:hypothetical protein
MVLWEWMRFLKGNVPQTECSLRVAILQHEVTMPAIASLEDLKSAQKEGLSISLCAMRFALCFT